MAMEILDTAMQANTVTMVAMEIPAMDMATGMQTNTVTTAGMAMEIPTMDLVTAMRPNTAPQLDRG
jgi:hypothetical protein